jgi:hypothetical protein
MRAPGTGYIRPMPPADRRYTDAEVTRILERATAHADATATAPTDPHGLTLAQLQDIGREIGVSPVVIAESAALVDVPAGAITQRVVGLPVALERIVPLPRPLTDAEWERLVVDLRETFDARGVTHQEGSLRQWTNGNLQALLEPADEGYRLRLRTRKGNAPGLMTGGAAFGVIGFTGLLTAGTDLGAMAATGLLMISGLATLLGTGIALLPWAKRRAQQMDDVAARLLARTTFDP